MREQNDTGSSHENNVDELDSGVTFEVVEGDVEGGRSVRRRGVYLLPNLLTTAALFCGFYAVVASMNGSFEEACVAMFVAMFLDGLDGRVARLTNTQSAFGAEYDSLSDLVAFGVAPALVVYAWSLSAIGKVGWMISFIYVACAALRLARYNTQVDASDSRYFTGLPSPTAAAVVASLVWVGFDRGFMGPDYAILVAGMTLLIGLSMVSNVSYTSFKEVDFKGRVPFVAILFVVMMFAVVFVDPPITLFIASFGYMLCGPIVSFWKRLAG
ncbi:MAG: CDP-diacylglycerol--serine O-phosphatidyltransferase [Pseudomonadales bacterium]|nr:CDP-diacylglycerol--serine O-phosphatidyltransferase [Pseudomonadales bacterium]